MASNLIVGKKEITPKRAKDKNGVEGVFISEKDWHALIAELKISTASKKKKEGILMSTLKALDEVELFLHVKKKLKNAEEAIREL